MLTREDRIALRERVKIKLESIPEGKRIHLDKELVENLLFEVANLKAELFDGKNTTQYESTCKFVVWSGDFLQKLDLSEVSFDDVIWDPIYMGWDCFINNDINYYDGIREINLANTNARIDFSKSYYSKLLLETRCKHISAHIHDCNFENVDLSSNTLLDSEFNVACENVNFANTGIKINIDRAVAFFNEEGFPPFYSCNFTGLDFSDYTVSSNLVTYGDNNYENASCNYTNTGLKIVIDPEDETSDNELDDQKSCLFYMIKSNRLTGTYIDGIKVDSSSDYMKFIDLLGKSEDKHIEELTNSIYNIIDEQTRDRGNR